MLRGKSEAKFSVIRKISGANAIKKIKKMKIKTKYNENISGPMTRT